MGKVGALKSTGEKWLKMGLAFLLLTYGGNGEAGNRGDLERDGAGRKRARRLASERLAGGGWLPVRKQKAPQHAAGGRENRCYLLQVRGQLGKLVVNAATKACT